MFGQNIYKKKTAIKLLIAANFILFYSLFPYAVYSENLPDELISESEHGVAAKVKDLAAKGINVNEKDEYGSTALFYAVKNNKSDCVKVLVENGADANIRNIDGDIPLTIASNDGSTDIVKILLNNGADPNMKGGYGWTALMRAVVAGHFKVVEELIAKGADPNMENDSGTTALSIAEKLEKTEMLKLLTKAEK